MIKVSVNLPEDLVDNLRRLAQKRGTTLTEVLRSAIRTETFIDGRMSQGAKILIEEKGEITKQLFFVWNYT